MDKNYNSDNLLMQFSDHVSDVIFLSIFGVIGCIPVLTIGTATTALYCAAMKSIRDEGKEKKNDN